MKGFLYERKAINLAGSVLAHPVELHPILTCFLACLIKSISYKSNLENLSAFKISSNGPHIFRASSAQMCAVHLRKVWRQMDFLSYSYKKIDFRLLQYLMICHINITWNISIKLFVATSTSFCNIHTKWCTLLIEWEWYLSKTLKTYS